MTKPEDAADMPEDVERLRTIDDDDPVVTPDAEPFTDPDLARELELDEIAKIDGISLDKNTPTETLEAITNAMVMKHAECCVNGWYRAAAQACLKLAYAQAHLISRAMAAESRDFIHNRPISPDDAVIVPDAAMPSSARH